MTASTQTAGAASHVNETEAILDQEWHATNWAKVHQNVRRLQTRIVKATQEGRWGFTTVHNSKERGGWQG